jgi:hypothetical protein
MFGGDHSVGGEQAVLPHSVSAAAPIRGSLARPESVADRALNAEPTAK